MNKTAIKNFAVWARRKLISEITYKAGLIGISEKGILEPLESSTNNIQFFDIGTEKPTEVIDHEIKQRDALIKKITDKESTSDYKTAFEFVVEEVAYTWFNRLIAIRFMEVNEYLPSQIRVLSSETKGKSEPDMVTNPFDTDIEFSTHETDKIMKFKDENKLDELFRMLFIKQCNKLNEVLPELFEKTVDYTEILLTISFTDSDGIVSHLINDIEEEDFSEAVEIIGWLFQYYNEERKNQVINIYKGKVKKEDIPAATQLFTTDWVVRYMVDNSLGRYWIERNPQSKLQEKLEYFVTPKNGEINYINEKVTLEDITFFDPCMGSGHILIYAFEVLMEIYRECGYIDRDAAQAIVENNIFGLDIDDRAYQLACFAVIMKARSYDRRFLTRSIKPNVYPICDYSDISMSENEDLHYLIDEFKNAKQYGSLINLKKKLDLKKVKEEIESIQGQLRINAVNIDKINNVISIAEILMNKYAVVCTNPPYLNKMNGELKNYINKHYKAYSADLFSVFMYRNFDFCKPNGYSAFMTPFVWMFIKTYEELRKYIIGQKSITTLVQMEYSAFEEATVPICSFVLKNGNEKEKGLYFKLSDFKGGMQVQKQKVLEALSDKDCGYFYETNEENFSKIPGSPIAYWVSNNLIDVYLKGKSLGKIAAPRKGNSTSDNNRFLRLWFEVSNEKINFHATEIVRKDSMIKRWYPYNKGGGYRKWYGFNEYLVDWYNDAEAIRNIKTAVIANYQYFMKPGLTWSTVSSNNFGIRWFDEGYIFDNGGCCIFELGSKRTYLAALLNSIVFKYIFGQLNPTLNFQSGEIAKYPVILGNNERVDELVLNNIRLSKNDWDSYETSWDFEKHPLLNGTTVQFAFANLQKECDDHFNRLKSNEEELNRIFIDIYGLQDELTPEVYDKDVTVNRIYDSKEVIPESMKGSKYVLTKLDVVKSFISYAVGCMFGRYSLDIDGLVYAGGEWDDSKYSTFIPDKDNCIPITDEEYFEDDIVGLFVSFVKKVYGAETLEENIDFIAKSLGNKGNTSRKIIRNYFIKDFYKDHLKTYKKRPIYWLYESGKQNGFKALIYMHRYTADTTGSVRVDYLHRIQKKYMSEINRIQDIVQNSVNAREVTQAEKRKEKLVKQLKETKEYDEKIAHLALNRIDIDLDDGVKVNYEKVQTSQDGKKLNILGKI